MAGKLRSFCGTKGIPLRLWLCWRGKAVKQRVSGIGGGYVDVLLWLVKMKYVFGYRGGVKEMNVLAKDLEVGFLYSNVN